MKVVRNVFLLMLLSITASGIPLYTDSVNFNSLIAPSTNSIILTASVENNLSSLLSVEVSLAADERTPINFNEQPLILELYAGDKLVQTIDYSSVATINSSPAALITPEAPVKFHMKLDQKKLNLSNGSYTLRIKPSSDISSIKSIVTPIYLHTDFTYKKALQSINRNQTGLVLYFPSNEFNYLIPITRIIPFTTTPLRKTVDELLKGPDKSLGLPEGPHIPESKLGLVRRTANVFLPEDIGLFETHSTTAGIALHSYVKSLTSIAEVENVQFYFNNRIIDIGFHDSYVKEPIAPLQGPRIFFGSITKNNRILLTPYEVGVANPSPEELFNMLKISGNIGFYDYSRQATVPNEVELLSHHVNNSTLTLVLNDAFAAIYKDKSSHRDLMLESILYTFTSLDGIKSVQLEIEGATDQVNHSLPLGTPLAPTRYINPEK